MGFTHPTPLRPVIPGGLSSGAENVGWVEQSATHHAKWLNRIEHKKINHNRRKKT
jgi:hypothetical protein